MSSSLYLPLLAIVAAIGLYFLGRQRAILVAGGRFEALHSNPGYHGLYLAILALLPALLLLVVWSAISRWVGSMYVTSQLGSLYDAIPPAEQSSFLRTARAIADGTTNTAASSDVMRQAVGLFGQYGSFSTTVISIVVVVLMALGLAYSMRTISRSLRARQFVERTAMVFLIAASGIAILTTLGIVLSLIFESYRFFEKVPVLDFLFGTALVARRAPSRAPAATAPGRQFRSLRRGPAVCRHAADHAHRHRWSPRPSG